MSTEAQYFRRRAEEERTAAAVAKDPAISKIHHEMARRYRDMSADLAVVERGGGAT